tara:strand:- start:4082 stop:6220 length:2139 start_codon:yes stop_codon:yes gene_type:complete
MNKLPLIGLVVFLSVVQFASVQSADIFDHNLDGRIDIEPVKRPITSSLMPMIRPPQPLLSLKLSNKDYENFDLALSQAKKWRWKSVKLISQKIENKDARSILNWIRYYNGADDLSFTDYRNFLNDNNHWPLIESIKIKAENKISFSDDHDQLINYFKNQNPLTGWGKIYYGNSLLKKGNDDLAELLIKEGYINGSFSRREQKVIINKFKNFLTQDDHKKRINQLLWNGKYGTARSLVKYVEKDYQKLFEARIGLISFSGGVDQLIANVPKNLINNAGLQHDRLRWRIKKRKYDSAMSMMLEINKKDPSYLERPDKFWKLKSFLVRRLIDQHKYMSAYKMSLNHGLTTNAEIAEAEWLAGWISITFLKDPAAAKYHFQRIWDVSSRPISKARASYWIAKSLENFDNDKSQSWYQTAAKYHLTFYGQLAATELKENKIEYNPEINPITENDFIINPKLKDVYSAVSLLNEFDQDKLVKKFILDLAENRNDLAATQAIYLASAIERYDFAVQAGKLYYYKNLYLEPKSFPTVPRPSYGKLIFPDQSLIHSVIRQESQFDPEAGSYAGAKGLMQLMPYTAKKVSKGLKIPYSKNKLTEDPSYNVILGSAYLDQLLSSYDGSYILTLAAYNAGPSRVNAWIKKYGDPRSDDISPVNWMELIPFKETRNYVQRVIENIQVYSFLDKNNLPQKYSIKDNLNKGYIGGKSVIKPTIRPSS